METPNKEILEWYVVERGTEGTMKLFNLTEKQFDKLFYPQAAGESDRWTYTEPKEYEEWTPVITPDTIQLARVIDKYYNELRKTKVNNKLKINTRSLSQEDIFHNTLLSLFKNGKSFKYTSDEDTIHFINKAFKKDKFDELTLSKIAESKNTEMMVDFTDYDEADRYIEDVAILDGLTPREKEVAELFMKGYTLTEVAVEFNVSRQYVNKIKNQLKTIFKEKL